MNHAFAELDLIAVSRLGREEPAEIRVGQPHSGAGGWSCPVTVLDYDAPVYGENALQALALGLDMVSSQLWHWVETGGKLLDAENREPFALEETFPRPNLNANVS